MKRESNPDTSPEQNPDSPTSKFTARWKIVNLVAKLMAVAVIIGLGWNVLSNSLQMNSTDAGASKNQGNSSSPNADSGALDSNGLASDFFSDFKAGGWTFGDADWTYVYCTESPEFSFLDLPTFRRTADPLFDDQNLIELFREMKAIRKEVENGLVLWHAKNLETVDQEMAMFTRDSVVQVIRTKYGSEATGSSIIESRPHPGSKESELLLMPICKGVVQKGARQTSTGMLTSAVLEIEPDNKIDIREYWKENGWTVNRLLGIDPSQGKQNQEEQIEKYRCSKDGMLIDATFFIDPETRGAAVVLMRLTYPED